MSILLNKILNNALNQTNSLNKFTKKRETGKTLRNKMLKDLFKLTGVDSESDLDTLEIAMLNTTAKYFGMTKTVCGKRNRISVIEILFNKYKQQANETLNKMGGKKKREFVTKYSKELTRQGRSFIHDENELFEAFLKGDGKSNNAFVGSATGLKLSTGTFYGIGHKPALALGIFGIQNIFIAGIGGVFSGAILGTAAIIQGLKYFNGKHAKDVASITMALILMNEEEEENELIAKHEDYCQKLIKEAKRALPRKVLSKLSN